MVGHTSVMGVRMAIRIWPVRGSRCVSSVEIAATSKQSLTRGEDPGPRVNRPIPVLGFHTQKKTGFFPFSPVISELGDHIS